MSNSRTTDIANDLWELRGSDLSDVVLESARLALAHALGVTCAGARLPVSEVARRASAIRGGPCSVIGRPETADPADAAFVNAVSGHASLQEDMLPGRARSGGHPGTYVIPAALAAGEFAGASGRVVVEAIILGYEAVDRIGRLAPDAMFTSGFRAVSVLGPFGAGVAAAIALGATPQQVATTLGFAANLAGGTSQGLKDGSMDPFLQAGFAGHAGVRAALLALAGGVASENALDGARGYLQAYSGGVREGRLDDAAGPEPAITGLLVKKYPSCLENQETIALVQNALPDGLGYEQIRAVRLTRAETGMNGVDVPGVAEGPPFTSAVQLQMSARFTTAAALLGRPVTDIAYFQSALDDQEAQELSERVELVVDDDAEIGLTVELADDSPISLTERPVDVLRPTAAVVYAQFLDRARRVVGDRAATEALAGLRRFDELADIRTLTEQLRIPTK